MWSRAAIAAAVLSKFGPSGIESFAGAVGWSRSSVFQLARVFRVFPPESRRLDASFYVHVEALKAKEPQKAVEVAERESLTVREAREAFRVHRDDPEAVTKDAARALVEAAAKRQASPVSAPEQSKPQDEAAALPEPGTLARRILAAYTRAEIDRLVRIVENAPAKDQLTPEDAE